MEGQIIKRALEIQQEWADYHLSFHAARILAISELQEEIFPVEDEFWEEIETNEENENSIN